MDLCISTAKYHVRLRRGVVEEAVEIKGSPVTSRVEMRSQPNHLSKMIPEVSNENEAQILSGQDLHGECKPDVDASKCELRKFGLKDHL
jgi:hypothetical protein